MYVHQSPRLAHGYCSRDSVEHLREEGGSAAGAHPYSDDVHILRRITQVICQLVERPKWHNHQLPKKFYTIEELYCIWSYIYVWYSTGNLWYGISSCPKLT